MKINKKNFLIIFIILMLICCSLFNGTINASNYKKTDLEKKIFF